MKKVLLIMSAALVVALFAGCSADTTEQAPVETTLAAESQNVSTTAPTPVTPADMTVEEWMAQHSELVATTSEQVGLEFSAQGNHFSFSLVMSGYSDEQIENVKNSCDDLEQRWTTLSKAEKEAEMHIYVEYFGKNSDMPIPQAVTQNFYDEAGKLVCSATFSVE